ncbi:hypothetical protein EJ065_5231 [Corallococcus coralloides]|uniref:Uncharacterized protein n=2 Tax=Corallococcus coralloides TaxID=184914 RepID=A0A410RY39_CORCK|nr:hypothetical protein EJ065_5231 [Corallococcus coralloides]
MTAAAQEASGNIDITGNDETATHACMPGSTVEITGNAISVTGASNSVTWKRGHGKSKPKVSRTGTDNKVTQEK